ncbi:hypothetical protein A3Q56_06736 [Intoshia linei]|uniref:Cadherin domain-containing protein n=1 Tax=Intoshia linei TaxID=1819745 RepID=A0A177AVZ6_9BILA|nr:hypothetical protein A3Q56_06736 [Intoshia linei]
MIKFFNFLVAINIISKNFSSLHSEINNPLLTKNPLPKTNQNIDTYYLSVNITETQTGQLVDLSRKTNIQSQPLQISIYNDTMNGSIIYRLNAIDRDANAQIIYTVENGINVNIIVDTITGILIIQNGYFDKDVYILGITARDSAASYIQKSSLFTLHVSIIKRQENEKLRNFTITIPEELEINTNILNLRKLKYSIPIFYEIVNKENMYIPSSLENALKQNVDTSLKFKIDTLTGMISINNKINYEEGKIHMYKFVVKTSALHLKNITYRFTVVNINIYDINDNFPQFYQSSFNVEITENVYINNNIFLIKAYNLDNGINGEIDYMIEDEKFHVITKYESAYVYTKNIFDNDTIKKTLVHY